jgi:hypothetical protein
LLSLAGGFNSTAGSLRLIGACRDLREFLFGDFAP